MSSLDLSIPIASTVTTATKPYTAYTISIRQPLRTLTLQKRYSDFCALHDALTSQATVPPPSPLPPKHWLKNTVSNPELAEQRRQDLERYLRAISGASDARWRNCSAWKTFLNLPASSNGKGTPSSSAGRIMGPTATITDPSIWLDVHRDLKSQLRDARQAVTRREQASSTQTQHEAAADAKGCLVRATAMVSVLDAGLQSISGAATKTKSGSVNGDASEAVKLGEGEIRRRKDLLASIKKEQEHIQDLLTAQSSQAHHQHHLNGAASPSGAHEPASPQKALYGAAPHKQKTGRVLGAAKETQETVPLDNQGVLQLQQQKMQEQDEDVTVLTTTVQRMREMGVQINSEIELQNEMLGLLDQDVERVGDKVGVARKRVGKIS